jgi:hypothetical protein
MRGILLRLSSFLLAFTIGITLFAVWSALDPPFVKGQVKPVPYVILGDDRFTHLNIGVDANISEPELYATLSQVADDHMWDGRDFWWYAYLFVDAYLIKDGKRSEYPAGKLRRYVPIANPESKDSWELHTLITGRRDRFSESLRRARRSF